MTLEQFLSEFTVALSQNPLWAVAIAVPAGLVSSAVCPCTLPVGLGVAGVAGASESQCRRAGLFVAAAFFAGILLNLAILGALAGRIGAVLSESFGQFWALAMAILSAIAALIAFRGPRLQSDRLAALRRPGVLGALGYGFIYSLGTSAAPLLLLLTAAAALGRPSYGLALALAFGLGRGLPFLLIGLFSGAVSRLPLSSRFGRSLQLFSGVVLLFIATYYVRAFVALL